MHSQFPKLLALQSSLQSKSDSKAEYLQASSMYQTKRRRLGAEATFSLPASNRLRRNFGDLLGKLLLPTVKTKGPNTDACPITPTSF